MDTSFISTRRIVAVLAAGAFGVTAPLAVSTLSQAAVHGHHVSSRDSDGDKMPNRWELKHGLDAHTPNAHRDADHDGLQNLTEFREGTDPQDDDSDDDGVEDGDDDTPDCDEATEDCTTDDCDKTGDDRAMTQSGDDCDETTSLSTRLVTYAVG